MRYYNLKNNMIYRIIPMVLLVAAVSACKPNDSAEAKKARLEKLKKDDQALHQQIAALERDLKVAPDADAAKNTVSLLKVHDTVFRHYIEVQGKVESEDNIFLTPKVPGAAIFTINVKRGDHVHKGEVVATQEYGTMTQTIAEVTNQLDLANTVFEKQKKLWDQKIGTEIQFLQAKNNKEALEKRLATLREQLSLYTMRSPIDGTVDDIDQSMRVGQVPMPGISGIRIVNYNNARVIADVSENYSSKIHENDHVLLFYPDINKNDESKVTAVGKAIDPAGRTFRIEIDPGKNINDLHPNMIAVVKINDYTNNKAMLVPVNIIQNDEKGSFVYVIEKQNGKNIAKKRTVTVGATYNGFIEILSGISDNDSIISSGYQNVVDGQEVNL